MIENIKPPRVTPEQQWAFGQMALEAIDHDAANGVITQQDAAAERRSVAQQMSEINEQLQRAPTS